MAKNKGKIGKPVLWAFLSPNMVAHTSGVAEENVITSHCNVKTVLNGLAGDGESIAVKKALVHVVVDDAQAKYEYLSATPFIVLYAEGGTFTNTKGANSTIQGWLDAALDVPFEAIIGKTFVRSNDDRIQFIWDITSYLKKYQNVVEGPDVDPPELAIGVFTTQKASTTVNVNSVVEFRYEKSLAPVSGLL